MGGEEYEDLDLSDEELSAIKDDEDDQGSDEDGDVNADTDEDANTDEVSDEDGEDLDQKDDDKGAEDDDSDADPEDNEDAADENGESADDAGDNPDAGKTDESAVNHVAKTDSEYNDKIKALEQQFDDGEIDLDERDELRDELREKNTRDIARQEITQIRAEEVWESEKDSFFKDNGYLKDNPIVYDSYAREVNRLTGDKAWSKKSGTAILAEAKKTVDAAFGIKSQKPVPPEKKEQSKGQKAVQKVKRTNAQKDSLKTLKDVPAGDDNTDGAFQYLDELDGPDLEAAVGKMSEAEQEAWANTQ